jgi:uncharacterized repeat protein (TIGR01451 family)
MTKHAALNPGEPNELPHDGTYGNPISVLHSEKIKYEITAVNASLTTGNVIIRDTLPPYLTYAGNATTGVLQGSISGTPHRWSGMESHS